MPLTDQCRPLLQYSLAVSHYHWATTEFRRQTAKGMSPEDQRRFSDYIVEPAEKVARDAALVLLHASEGQDGLATNAGCGGQSGMP